MDELNDDIAAHLEEEGVEFALRTVVGLFDLERPRGILSKTDRKYLAGLKDYKHEQSELNRKQEIRQRAENSLRDFPLLTNHLDNEQKEKIFSSFEEDELEELLSIVLMFIYQGTGRDINQLENIIKSGLMSDISLATGKPDVTDVKSISVDIDVEMEPDVDEAYNRFKRGEVLLPEEIGLLVRHGRLSMDELQGLDKSDPNELSAKLERGLEASKEMAEESDDVEPIDESSRNTDQN